MSVNPTETEAGETSSETEMEIDASGRDISLSWFSSIAESLAPDGRESTESVTTGKLAAGD